MGTLMRMERDKGVTNIRNLNFKHWKQWFGLRTDASYR